MTDKPTKPPGRSGNDKALTTQRGQDAWVKNAVTKGMTEQDAKALVVKMAASKKASPQTSKLPSARASTKSNSTSAASGDLFVDQSLPSFVTTTGLAPHITSKPLKSPLSMEISQLPLWPDVMRSLPNEILRSALFNARNKNKKREMMINEPIAVIGDGRISYQGQELRQNDEKVWLQLVHLARSHVAGALVEFTANSFCRAIDWDSNGKGYTRLKECLRRMQATSLDVYSARLGRGVSLSMIPFFEWRDGETQKPLKQWRVRIAPELVELFGADHYTRMEWAQRLVLPEGLATWLHGYLASHRVPHPIKIETIARGAGIATKDKPALRRLVKDALTELVNCGFLINFEIENDLVTVKRTSDPQYGNR